MTGEIVWYLPNREVGIFIDPVSKELSEEFTAYGGRRGGGKTTYDAPHAKSHLDYLIRYAADSMKETRSARNTAYFLRKTGFSRRIMRRGK